MDPRKHVPPRLGLYYLGFGGGFPDNSQASHSSIIFKVNHSEQK
jgi:hypothetical protein